MELKLGLEVKRNGAVEEGEVVTVRSRILLLSLFEELELAKFKGANKDLLMGATGGIGSVVVAEMFWVLTGVLLVYICWTGFISTLDCWVWI